MVYELARTAMEVTEGRFREEVEDVLANDHHAVVLARHQFTRDGQSKEYRTAHVYEIHDGQLTQCWEQPQDLSTFDEALGHSLVTHCEEVRRLFRFHNG